MNKVLVLDANQRSALAATRSLGKKGIHVITAGEKEETLAGSSRHCSERFIYPSPKTEPENFIKKVARESASRGAGVVFPMTELTTELVIRNKGLFKGISIPFAVLSAFERLTDKAQLIELAGKTGVKVPKTRIIRSYDEISSLLDIEFPAVIKPRRSWLKGNNGWFGATVKYARTKEELESVITENDCFRDHPFLIQEYIKGEGRGIFALYDNGKPAAFFAHRRIREKPPSGGVSVLSESVCLDPELKDMAQRLLDSVGWHGVAMVEFKVTPQGAPFLMEVNARFWGSLQLAVDSGVDFPFLLYQIAANKEMTPITEYAIGKKSRWFLGDIDNLYLTIKERRKKPWPAIKKFLLTGGKDTRHEVNRWEDMGPFVYELRSYFSGIFKK